jgi:hypothetical protein
MAKTMPKRGPLSQRNDGQGNGKKTLNDDSPGNHSLDNDLFWPERVEEKSAEECSAKE